MVDREEFFSKHSHMNDRLVSVRYPKLSDLLVLAHKVGSIDPEGRFLCGMARDFHHREVLRIDPNASLEKVLILALRSCLHYVAAVGPQVFLADSRECVVRRS